VLINIKVITAYFYLGLHSAIAFRVIIYKIQRS